MAKVKRINREQTVNPNLIREHKLASMHPKMSEEDYISLKLSIQEHGQKVHVLMYRNLLVDGRHRVKACKELGLEVLVCDLSSNAKLQDIKDEVMATEKRRHESKTQKAIQAFYFGIENRISQAMSAEQFGVSVALVEYVSSIYSKRKRPDLIDILRDGKKVQIGDRKPTDSLSAVAKALKEDSENVNKDTSEVINWKEDAFIKTEPGKEWYYSTIKMAGLENNVMAKMLLAEMANLKFKDEQ